MKTIYMMAVAAAIAFSAASFTATPVAAKAAKAGSSTLRNITACHTKPERTATLQATRNARQRPPASVAAA
jgi:hypothetical protein